MLITVDATLERISGVSWHGRQLFRVRVSDCLSFFPSRANEPFRIAECELLAAALAIVLWSKVDGVRRHIILCTDNRNVFHWVQRSKAKQGVPNRTLRRLIDYLLGGKIEVSPSYLRSAHNLTADCLTRCADTEFLDWLHEQRMQQAGVPLDWLQGLGELGNLHNENSMSTFEALWHNLEFFKTLRNHVCEWGPGFYTTAGVLSSCGIPTLCYGVVNPRLHELVAGQVREYRFQDISVLIGYASSRMEINDFKADELHIGPRYAILVTPAWVQDRNAPEGYWKGQKLVDSSALGDVVAAQWWMYSKGFNEEWLAAQPSVCDLGVLKDGYLQAGLPIAEDPVGHVNVQGFPNTIGRAGSIQTYGERRAWSRMSHMPFPTRSAMRSNEIAWPIRGNMFPLSLFSFITVYVLKPFVPV